ncbi:MAG: LPXTG cell wall anchor domain-containing protein [Actinomycetota bacterium]
MANRTGCLHEDLPGLLASHPRSRAGVIIRTVRRGGFAGGWLWAHHGVVKQVRPPSILCLVLTFLILASSPAWAQKDPFAPLVRPETEAGATTTAPVTGQPVSTEPAPVAPEPFLPETGTDLDLWASAAMLLVLMGSGLLALDRYRRLA